MKCEKLVEELTKQLLLEMAIPRSKFAEFIESNVKVVINHLILCLTQPTSNSLLHWKGEIYGNFSRFDRLKYSKKYPSYEDFMDCGMETWFERIQDQLEVYILDVYSQELKRNIFDIKDIQNINISKLKTLIMEYLNWCLQNIDYNNGTINKSKIYKKLDELILQYNK